MAVDSIVGGAGIVPSASVGDVTLDFDAPPDIEFPGGPTLTTTPAAGMLATSRRIANIAYVRSVSPPQGGTANQVLAKNSAANFDYVWVNQSGGPGGPVTASDVSVDPATLIPVAITDVQEALVDIYDRGVFIVNGGGAPGPGPGGSWPTGPLVTSNGTDLGSLGIGAGLSLSGTFPSQTLALVGGASITLTVGSLAAESITLDGTPMVPLAGGDPGDVLTKQPDESIAWAPPSAGLPAGGNPGDVLTKPNGSAAWARIGDPDGLVIGNPTGGALGTGTLNIQGEIYKDGAPFVSGAAGFTQSFSWTAGVDPDNVSIYINNSGAPLTIAAISAAVEVGATGTIQVVRADAGDVLSAGDNITNPFDVDKVAGTVDLLNIVDDDLPTNWRLGLRTTGAWPGSIGVITVYLGPPRPPLITSSLDVSGTIGQAFSYQITTTAAVTSFAANVPPPVGLTVNTATGLISGVPTVAGNTNVTISASNSAGTNTRTLVIRVLDEPTAWDPARASTTGRVVFSNQFRTMLVNGAAPYVSCLSNSSRPPGKYYVEVTVSNDYGWFGIATADADLETYVSVTSGSAGMWYEGSGQGRIRLSLNFGGSWNNFGIGAGAVIGMAFDVSGSGTNKMWARDVTADGPWSGLSSMDGDPTGPTTATNGMPIAWLASGPYYLMASSGFAVQVTMNPGPTGLRTPPAGFQWWDS